MAQDIVLKRSAVPAKIPLVTDLELGEVAINTYDGKMFIKKNDGADSIVEFNSPGPKGDKGDTGDQGIQGLPGNDGATGSQGLKGDTGNTGSQGIQGITGDVGAQGIQGIQGIAGDDGADGIQGADGAVGPAGPSAVSTDANNAITLGSDSLIYYDESTGDHNHDADYVNVAGDTMYDDLTVEGSLYLDHANPYIHFIENDVVDQNFRLNMAAGVFQFNVYDNQENLTSTAMVIDAATGYVGIGTDIPETNLNVHKKSVEVGDVTAGRFESDAGGALLNQWGGIIELVNNAIGGDQAAGITFACVDEGGTNRHMAVIAGLQEGAWATDVGPYIGGLVFHTRGADGQNERMRITSSGDVIATGGITTTGGAISVVRSGTTSPKLHVRNTGGGVNIGTGSAGNLVIYETDANGAQGNLLISSSKGTYLRLNYAGATKIETTSYGAAISGNLIVNGYTYVQNAGTQSRLYIQHDGSTKGALIVVSNEILYLASHNWAATYLRCIPGGGVNLYYNNASKLATTSTGISVTGDIDGTGNVVAPLGGVLAKPSDCWTGSSQYWIDTGGLYSSGGYNTSITSNGYRNASGTWTSLGANGYTGAAVLDVNPQGYFAFRTDAVRASGAAYTVTERMRILANGFVGIGTTTPDVELDVNGSIHARNGYVYASSGEYYGLSGMTFSGQLATGSEYYKFKGQSGISNMFLSIYHSGSYGWGMKCGNDGIHGTIEGVDASGNALGGTYVAAWTLGDEISLRFNNSQKFATTNTGVTITGTLVETIPSDMSVKQDIEDIDPLVSLVRINNLKPITWSWTKREFDKYPVVGFSAQNWGDSYPNDVTDTELFYTGSSEDLDRVPLPEDTIKTYNRGPQFYADLVNYIQVLEQRLTAQDDKNDALEARLAILEHNDAIL